MLYLAQIEKKRLLGGTSLLLLARQKSEYIWEILPNSAQVDSADNLPYNEGQLVLVKLDASRQVAGIKEAKDWVLGMIKNYLNKGMTPESLQKQTDKVEQWQQSLTLQSQDLARRTLEVEARREQLQELESKLKKERRYLELVEAKLQKEREALKGK